jgi:hypothetical protein
MLFIVIPSMYISGSIWARDKAWVTGEGSVHSVTQSVQVGVQWGSGSEAWVREEENSVRSNTQHVHVGVNVGEGTRLEWQGKEVFVVLLSSSRSGLTLGHKLGLEWERKKMLFIVMPYMFISGSIWARDKAWVTGEGSVHSVAQFAQVSAHCGS